MQLSTNQKANTGGKVLEIIRSSSGRLSPIRVIKFLTFEFVRDYLSDLLCASLEDGMYIRVAAAYKDSKVSFEVKIFGSDTETLSVEGLSIIETAALITDYEAFRDLCRGN